MYKGQWLHICLVFCCVCTPILQRSVYAFRFVLRLNLFNFQEAENISQARSPLSSVCAVFTELSDASLNVILVLFNYESICVTSNHSLYIAIDSILERDFCRKKN